MMFRKEYGKANVTTITERKTRYTMLVKNNSRHSDCVMGDIKNKLLLFPKETRKSVTFDRGTEFSNYPILTKYNNISCYYCDPRAPWQKGTVENTNARLRKYLPRELNIEGFKQERLDKIAAALNNTPRKCLGYYTPNELMGLDEYSQGKKVYR